MDGFQTGLAMVEDRSSPRALRVALIDPEPVDRVVTQHILTRRGHQVTSFDQSEFDESELDFTGGLVARLTAGEFDVVVLSGEAVSVIKVPSGVGRVPVVAITDEHLEQIDIADFSVVLPRPVGSRELLAAVAIASRKNLGVIVHR